MLYPAELYPDETCHVILHHSFFRLQQLFHCCNQVEFGRCDWILTSGLRFPKAALQQTELHTEILNLQPEKAEKAPFGRPFGGFGGLIRT